MNNRKAFTLVELLVVIAIIALLMAILMPALNRAKKLAKEVYCRANLKQWGLVWVMYTEDYEGKLPVMLGPNWMKRLIDYSGRSEKMLYCPMATRINPSATGDAVRYSAMGGGEGSYTLNEWIYDEPGYSNRPREYYWRNVNQKGLYKAPVMGDGFFRSDGQPFAIDKPPTYDGQNRTTMGKDEMRLFCINRHDGFINVLFMDWSTRKVGLKELWTLEWHRGYEPKDCKYTIVGGSSIPWPDWMQRFKDY